MTLVVVTATTNYERAKACLDTWGDVQKIIVVNGGRHGPGTNGNTILTQKDYLGVVPAFEAGVNFALENSSADIIACLHDDVEIHEPAWVDKVTRAFDRHPTCGLLGFGGAIGVGSDRIYKDPYNPMQLARIGFRSNLVDAEVHGVRSLLPERVACLDGFSQIGRRAFWLGQGLTPNLANAHDLDRYGGLRQWERPFTYLYHHGVIHHAYDGMLGCLAARAGWETWYLPIRCRHLGGQTAVADAGYQDWAKGQIPGGDQGFWQQSHERWYELFSDVLPLRV